MAVWWILLLAAIIATGSWVARSSRKARSKAKTPTVPRRAAPLRQDAPIRPGEGAHAGAVAEPAAAPTEPKKPSLRSVPPPALVELSGLKPAPDRIDCPWEEPSDPEALSRILGCASEVLDRVAARRRILESISNPNPDPRALTDIVVSDPALSARILRTVNSPFFALRQPMASVFRAVLYLGHNEVRNVVWNACIAEAMGESSGPVGEMLDATWRHSFVVSRVAYALGRAVGVPEPDAVATAALLHDAGKLVVISVEPEKAETIYRSAHFSSSDQMRREWEALGVGHGLLGGEVVRAWGLPAEVAAVVAQHHLPSFRTSDHAKGDARLVAIVHLADLLCHAFARSDADEVIHLPAAGWLSDLGISGDLSSLCDATVLRALRCGVPGPNEGRERAA